MVYKHLACQWKLRQYIHFRVSNELLMLNLLLLFRKSFSLPILLIQTINCFYTGLSFLKSSLNILSSKLALFSGKHITEQILRKDQIIFPIYALLSQIVSLQYSNFLLNIEPPKSFLLLAFNILSHLQKEMGHVLCHNTISRNGKINAEYKNIEDKIQDETH